MEGDDELTQMTLLDTAYEQKAAELWEREQRQTKVGRPKKGEERQPRGGEGAGGRERGSGNPGAGGGSGARISGATPGGPAQRGGLGRWRHPDQEAGLGGTLFDVEAVTGLRVARSAVVGALKRALGRIRDPERWTPLHLAASAKEERADLCWWSRWPPPESVAAVRWSAEGAIIATTPDRQTQGLATVALRGVGDVERGAGHAATVELIEQRIEQVGQIEAEYVTRADIESALARLHIAGRGREEQ